MIFENAGIKTINFFRSLPKLQNHSHKTPLCEYLCVSVCVSVYVSVCLCVNDVLIKCVNSLFQSQAPVESPLGKGIHVF